VPPARAAPPRRSAAGPGPATLPAQRRTLPAVLPLPRQLSSGRLWPLPAHAMPLPAHAMDQALGVQPRDQPRPRTSQPGRLRRHLRRRPPLAGPGCARPPPQLRRPTRRPRPRRAGSDRRGCKPCAHGRASARARPRLLARRPLRFAVAARRAAPRMHVSSHINRKVKPLSHQSCVKTPHLTLARLMRRTSPTHSRLRQSHGTAPRGHRGKRPGSRPQRTGDAATAACRALLPLLKNEGQGQAGGEELCRGLS